MSGLATRCPACSTIFRVVADQLRVSDGWVRCGRCAEVFNAAERLVDVDTGAPARAGAAAVMPAGGGTAIPPSAETPHATPAAAADFLGRAKAGAAAAGTEADRGGSRPPAPPSATRRTTPPARAAVARPGLDDPQDADAPARLDDGPRLSPPAADPGPASVDAGDTTGFATTAAAVGDDTNPSTPHPAEPTPSFVRRAEKAQRWRSPHVRKALVGGVAFTALLLGVQAALAWRDHLAARHAALKPALAGACAILGCSVQPPRQIDSLSVESSGLVRLEKSALYRLSIALRNRAAIGVALPALELSLTDSQGRLLVRRVLRAADFGVNQNTLQAGAELALQATLQAAVGGNGSNGPGAEPIAGYTIELFYP